MSVNNDGGPAFPQSYRIPGSSTIVGPSGLTIRDWFAGQFLGVVGFRMNAMRANWTPDRIASVAYEIADAMLAARTTTKGGK